MQHELPPAEKNTVNSGQILEIILNSLDHRHSLTALILNHRILFQGLRKNSDLRHPAQSFYTRFLSVKDLSGDSRNFSAPDQKAVKKVATRSWKPLKTDKVHTNANVAKATPQTEMAEMTLMALCDFLEKR